MFRSAALLLPLLFAGCIAGAAADTLDTDVITLATGDRLTGELVDVQDGKYWLLKTDGQVVAIPFHDVSRVEMAGSDPAPVEELPLPDWRDTRTAVGGPGTIGGGFDFGLLMGGRLRFHIESPAIDHVDLRLGVSLLYASSLGGAAFLGAEVAFFGNSPVHLALSLNTGPAVVSGLYPFLGAGASLQFDPKGPFEFHVGAIVGTTLSYFAVAPEVSTSWVW